MTSRSKRILPALVAATLMAGGIFISAQAVSPAPAKDAIVARVNGKDIHESDMTNLMAMMGPRVQGVPADMLRPMLIQQLVNMQVIDDQMKDAKLDKDPEVISIMERARQDIMRSIFIRRAAETRITDAMLKEKYGQMKEEGKQVHARHILVKDEKEAKDIIVALEKGEDFAKLAAAHSMDGTKDRGGDLGFFSKNMMVPEFAEAAFALKDKTFTKKPVKTQFGYHVIEVLERKETDLPSFDEIKDDLKGSLIQDEGGKVLEDLKAKAKVEILDPSAKEDSSDKK
ncbi:MAG TPA: peptidylprolyl isomerase [Rhodospirillaceae bacterium]|nr:MAG: hypothetical protein A2018_01105 [Alphaproteobacteria bacterium GWF2_58_20]HAU29756.1 peptidylprolyl isomerase [Rhodospirillaceae bacterium]